MRIVFFRQALAACLVGASAARAGQFSDLRPGAKAMGMGQAFSAVSDDAFAPFFNPAGTANAPYSLAGTTFGRFSSPVGNLTFAAVSYLRPFEPVNSATVGTAYYGQRQTNGGDKDELLFHYAQEVRTESVPLARPLKVGGNVKFVRVAPASGRTLVGLGLDAGVLVRSNVGWTGSFVASDLVTEIGVRKPTWSLGSAYLWRKWLTLALDMRSRPGLAELHPGVEASFHQGLLKVRAGRGFRLDGVSQLAFGFGVDFSPFVIDAAMTVPTGGPNRAGGAYQAGVQYRFGAPSFTGRFVGSAAVEAQTLREEIKALEEKRRTLQEEVGSLGTRREIGGGELQVLEKRVKEAESEYQKAVKRKDEVDFEVRKEALKLKNAQPPAPKPERPPPPRPESWPRRHASLPGETLRSVAKDYYGDPNLWEKIYDANKDKVERGLIKDGAALIIPAP